MSNFHSDTPAFLLYHLCRYFFFSLPPPSCPPLSIFVIHLILLLSIYSTLTLTFTTLFILPLRSCCINPFSPLYQSPSCPLAPLPYTSILPLPAFSHFPNFLIPPPPIALSTSFLHFNGLFSSLLLNIF